MTSRSQVTTDLPTLGVTQGLRNYTFHDFNTSPVVTKHGGEIAHDSTRIVDSRRSSAERRY